MRKLIGVATISLLVIFAIAAIASAAPNWRIEFQCNAPDCYDIGTVYFGALGASTDAKDGNDQTAAPISTTPYVQFAESRPELGVGYIKQDMRALYNSGTKVWSNLVIDVKSLPDPTTVTLKWTPGDGSYALPAGSYKLIDLTEGVEYDLSTAGSLEFETSIVTGQPKRFCMIATIGNGPVVNKLVSVTGAGSLMSSATVDGNLVYLGDELRRAYRVDLTTGTRSTLRTGASSAGAVRSRMALYDGKLYGVDQAGYLFWVNAAGGSAGAVSAGANPSSVPAVVSVQGVPNIYVGTPTGIKRFVSGASNASFTVGAAVGSPAIPGTDKVWFGAADGNLYCLNSNLDTVLSTKAIGGVVGDPMVNPYAGTASAGGGSIYGVYNNATLADMTTATVAGNITSAPYVDYATQIAYFLTDNNYLNAVNTLTGAKVPGWPIALEGNGPRVTAPVLSDAKVVVTGGTGDNKLYIVDKATTAMTWLSGNGNFVGSPSLSADGANIVVPNTDGNIYVVTIPSANVGPIISDVAATNITASGATITWTTSEASNSKVLYGENGYTSSTDTDANMVTSHSVTLTGLAAWRTYHFCVMSMDAEGSATTSADLTFKTGDATAPSTPVVTDEGVTTTGAGQISASWTAADDDSGITEYQYSIGTAAGGTQTLGWTSTGTATSVTKTGLTLANGTTYYVNVKAKNAAGLWSTVGSSDGIKVYAPADNKLDVAVLNDGNALDWAIADLSALGTAPYIVSNRVIRTIEASALATDLASYDVLVLPTNHSYSWLDQANQDLITTWVSNGGTLIIEKPASMIQDPICDAFGANYWIGWQTGLFNTVSVADANNLLVKAPNVLATSDLTGWAATMSATILGGGSEWQFATRVASAGYVSGYARYGNGSIVVTGTPVESTSATAAVKVIENMLVINGNR